ncbi:aminopeptidase N isoform X1 [Ciona intestinalis]
MFFICRYIYKHLAILTMGSDFDDISQPKSMKGKCVFSKTAVIAYVVVTCLVIVAVGLMAGLINKDQTPVQVAPVTTTTKAPAAATTIQQLQTTDITADPTVVETTVATTTSPGPWSSIRLPPFLVPTHYVVDLKPQLEPDTDGIYRFYGKSQAVFMVNQSTNYIYIHSNKLNYTKVEVNQSGDAVPVQQWWLYEPNQYLIVELQSNMTIGSSYTLITEFHGELADDLGGLYRSTYTNAAGNPVVIATTQMQPTDARKSFPCFDEPALKATFDIFLSWKSPYFALSNTPPVVQEVTNMWPGYSTTQFNTTVKMSTYLLAFVVCDFDSVEDPVNYGVQAKIYARPAQILEGNANYSAKITPEILKYFEEYFNVSYPLAKSDQIAVPDFAAGAMENWGLVIYRETALLYNPQVNSASNQQRVAAVVAHELAHQWFGNLISPLWWDELWLNEGFASYVEYLGTNQVEPTWEMMDQFTVSDLQRALNYDGLVSSRPIVAENVNTPSDINALFDTISYSKGACIIRMINQFAGDNAFKLGLENYLKEYAYGPVDHNQLFAFWSAAIASTGGTNPAPNFATAMQSWTLQMGYPVVTMTKVGATVTVTQQRFLLDPKADKTQPPSNFGYKWTIPLWYVNQSDTTFITMEWVYPDQAFTIDGLGANDFVIGNYGGYGYYLVNYDDANWKKIISQLNNDYTKIEVKTRGQLIYDAFSLARAGQLHYNITLSTTEYLVQDFHYVPWESCLDSLAYLDQMLGRSKVYGVYSNYISKLVAPLYTNVTWNDTGSHLQQYQRINAIGASCAYGNQDCINNVNTQFSDWKTTATNSITPNLRTTVYCNAIAYGETGDWDFVWEKYKVESNSQEKAKLEYALSCTRTPWVIRRFLDYILDENGFVRKQDASSVLQDLCYNEYSRDITWDYIRQRWDYIYNVYGTGFFSFSGIISSCTSHFSTEFELQELESFKATNSDKLGSGVDTVDQSLEKTRTNIQWRADYEDTIFAWLSDNTP